MTTGNISDKHVVDQLLDKKEDGSQPLYGDSAYNSKELEQLHAKKKMIRNVNRQGYRNKAITQKEQKENKKKSKVRARVEHVFGFITKSMNGMFLKYRSLIRNKAGKGLINLTYNLFRLVKLNIELRK